MKALRSLLFWSHLVGGAAAGLVILVMSATGAILALKPQILQWIERGVRVVAASDAPRLAPSVLLAAARSAARVDSGAGRREGAGPGGGRAGGPGNAPGISMTIERDASAAAAIGLGREGTVYVDPYSGAVLGSGSSATQDFFRSVENWHRWLAVAGENRAFARSIADASNFAFLILALSGLYLWWPRKWTPQHRRAILVFTRARTGRARDFNWHNVIGFWCAPAIIVMTASGVVMSYPWANNLLYRAMGSVPPAPAGERAAPVAERSAVVSAAQLDELWARAERQVPTWRTITLRLPNRPDAPAAFTINDARTWNRFARSQLTLDVATADVRQWQPYDSNSLGQKARGWLRFAHTGELAGLAGQIIAGLGCLGGVMLVYTGLALAIRRLVNWDLWARAAGRRAAARPVDAMSAARTSE